MLGSKLKAAREARQLPLSEVEWATRIRAEYLAALEGEEYDRLPGTVYARGFLRTYATYLGLDPDPLVAEFNAAYTGAHEIVSTRPAVMGGRRRLLLTPGLLAGISMLLVAAVFAVYMKTQFDRSQAFRAGAGGPTPPILTLPTDVPTPSIPSSPTPSPTYSGVHVVVRVDQPVWLGVEVDGKASAQTGAGEVFPAGTTLTFDGTTSVRVRSHSATHTFVAVNGRDLGAMPASGDQTYTRVAGASPTPGH